jgi:AcrR family transcriptional regulator
LTSIILSNNLSSVQQASNYIRRLRKTDLWFIEKEMTFTGEEMKNGREKKEYEIRDEAKKNRENFMLEKAREIVNNGGIESLSLPELARVSGYSRPTIYKYFTNMEDLLTALVVASTAKRVAYYEKAVTFEGRAREKIMAIHSLNFGILNDAFHDWLSLLANKHQTKSKPDRQKMLNRNNERILEIHADIVRKAVREGDLTLAKGMDEYRLVFTLTAATIGGCVMTDSDSPVINKWFKKINFMHGTFGQIILDGMGWRPLSTEWDYARTLERLYSEVFPELPMKAGNTGG